MAYLHLPALLLFLSVAMVAVGGLTVNGYQSVNVRLTLTASHRMATEYQSLFLLLTASHRTSTLYERVPIGLVAVNGRT